MMFNDIISGIQAQQNLKGYTDYKIAKLSGINQSHYVRVMSGETNPTFLTLQSIANAVGLELTLITKVHR